ncbi:MAG: metallophosphoesterase [Deltaproteobacteria bacterium]|nr:metallophosphoesterase [Deltaproteobacteria bacterium]
MRAFVALMYATTLVAHLPVALLVRPLLVWAGVTPSPAVLLVGALLLALPFGGRLRLAMWDRPVGPVRRLVVEELYFVHWCAAVMALPLFLLAALGYGLISQLDLDGLFSWATGQRLYGASYGVALALAAWGVLVRRRWLRVVTIDVPVAGLGTAFDGYRIAQLSDLHVGSLCPPTWAERWVRIVNELDVDAVALTGDYVSSGVTFHQAIAAALGRLQARDGVFAVMGNHDYFGDGEPLMTLLREGGVVLLRNEHVTVERNGDHFCLAGVDDRFTERTDIAAALAGRDPDLPLIVLVHDPTAFLPLADRGAALVLCGHTHWGQLAVPGASRRFNYARLSQPFCAGRYERRGAQLYVTPGLGTTGPPLRIGTWPEITVLRLRAGPQSPP